jgi:hypothetical protein
MDFSPKGRAVEHEFFLILSQLSQVQADSKEKT